MIGETISHYRILERIGGGAMGVVFKAEDLKLKRIVALKFLPPALTTDTESKKRFIHEAQAASSLQHNNICTVHDIDETDDGQMFICMDYYEGETLKEKIGRGPLSLEEAVDITGQVARGLAEAHKHGIVHRDVKPANILITKDGVAKILDFGLAKLVGGSMLTGDGTTLGTAAYMSPEQLLGERVDARSDIFSIGIIVFEMLTRQLPFKGERAPALMFSIINDEPLILKELRNDAPEKLIEFCERCLQKDVDARPRTMEEVLRILGMTEKIRVVMAGQWHNWSWRKRAAGAASLVVLLAISLWLARPLLIPSSRPGITRPVVAVLPFRNFTGRAETAEWPSLIQNLIINGFLGVENLAVMDQLTLNNFIKNSLGPGEVQRDQKLYDLIKTGNSQYVVDGSIGYSGDRYVIKYSLVDPSAGGAITTPKPITIGGKDSLSYAARIISNEITNYLQVKISSSPNEKDIRPWISRGSQNIQAVQEFMEASQMTFNGITGNATHLRRAIELDSTFISPRIWLIPQLVVRGELNEAKANYEVLERLKPRASPLDRALIDYAGAWITGDTVSQIKYLKIALEYSPDNNVLLYNLALAEFNVGDYRGAVDALLQTVKMKWQYSTAYFLLGYSYDQLKEFAKAKAILEQSLSLPWVYFQTYDLLSVYALRDRDTVRARKFEDEYLQAGKLHGRPVDELYAYLGSINLSAGFYNTAAGYYQAAASRDPKNAGYRDGLGEAFFLLGKREAAEKQFLQAVRLDSSQARPHLRLGEVYETNKDTAAAIRQYNNYLRLDSVGNRAAEVRQRLSNLERGSKNAANLRNAGHSN